jgi:hypothetical protein
MEQFVIELKDESKRNEFLRVLKELGYVRLVKAGKDLKKAKFLKEFGAAIKEIEDSERKGTKLMSAKDMIRELRS